MPVLLIAAVSCSKAGEMAEEGSAISLKVSTPQQVKTWLDTETGGSPIPVFWSDGDAINVNGQKSAPLTVGEGEKVSSADFSLRNAQAPFYVIYPASDVTGTSYESGSIEITLPSQQEYCPTTFGKGAAVLFGYAQDDQAPVHLYNVCAAVKVQIKASEDMDVKSVSLVSNSETAPLCGVFTACPQIGELVPQSGKGGTSLSLDITEPVHIGASETSDFYLTVPAGEYPDGFTFTFVRNSDLCPMRCTWTPAVALEAGHLYCFDNVDFVPGVRYIESADDWNEFALALNSGEGVGVWVEGDSLVRMTAGFAVKGDLEQVTEFPYALECNGVTVSRTDATKPLFGKVGGSVRNLNLAGTSATPALADTLSGGKLLNCNTSVEVLLQTDADVVFGALVSEATDGALVNCTNAALVKIEQDGSQANLVCTVGGLAGHVTGTGEFISCRNTGNITVTMDNIGHYIYNASFGGIVGKSDNDDSGTISEVHFKDCSNAGNITATNTSEGNTFSSSLGGILGRAWGSSSKSNLGVPDVEIYQQKVFFAGCSNSGKLTDRVVSAAASQVFNGKSFVGGIAGLVNGHPSVFEGTGCTFEGCTSSGDVIPYDYVGEGQLVRCGLCNVCGGFVGGGANLTFKDCNVTAVLGSEKRLSFAVSAGIGLTAGKFGFDGCTFLPTSISMPRCYMTAQNNWSLVATYPKDSGTASLSEFAFEYKSDKPSVSLPEITGSYVKNCSLGCKSLKLNIATVTFNTTTAACSSVGTKFNSLDNCETFSVQGNKKGASTTSITAYCGKTAGDVTFTDNVYSNK